MKTILTIALLVALESNGATVPKSNYNWSTTIKRELGYPKDYLQSENKAEKISILYLLNENGEMQIVSISSANNKLKKYVWEKLKNKSILLPHEPVNKISKLEITFKSI
jgi:hypothetical protein